MAAGALLCGTAGGFLIFTPPASASTGTNVDYYAAGWADCDAYSFADLYCLWYSPGLINGVWGSTSSYTSTISGTFSNDSYGTGGVGEDVRNNAASMASWTDCHVTTWVSPGREGDWNWVDVLWGGNLTSGSIQLRNNEASIDTDTCE
jgi:hypothetical protein